jgi:F0F1-type ATP synthase membrane subunit b/b'
MKIFIFLVSIIVSHQVLAAGGKVPQNWNEFFPSLVWPAFNVAVLASLLIWKLRTPARNYFNSRAETIANIMERAQAKAKEAEMMMQMQRKKLDGLESEIKKIHTEADVEIEKFKSSYQQEVDERISKLKTDASMKIEAEKKQLSEQLNTILLDQVIAKAKNTIRNDNDLNNKATSKILEGLK